MPATAGGDHRPYSAGTGYIDHSTYFVDEIEFLMRPNFEAVIFDFDGTLIDSSAAIVSTFSAVLRKHGAQPWDEERIRRSIGRPLAELFAEVFPDGRPDRAELVETYRRLSKSNGFEEVHLMPGAREILEALETKAGLGIATSRTARSTTAILQRFGLQSRFGSIVGIDMVRNPKPHPEPIEKVLGQLEITPTRSLLVGDTPDDILAARRAGVTAVGITTGAYDESALRHAGASRVIARLIDLINPRVIDSVNPDNG